MSEPPTLGKRRWFPLWLERLTWVAIVMALVGYYSAVIQRSEAARDTLQFDLETQKGLNGMLKEDYENASDALRKRPFKKARIPSAP